MLLARGAGAADKPKARFEVTRTADAQACPAREEMIARIAARLGRDPTDDRAPTQISVQFRGAGPFAARVVVLGPDVPGGERVFESGVCDDVANSVALAVGMLLEPVPLPVRKREPAPLPAPSAEPVADAPPAAPEPPWTWRLGLGGFFAAGRLPEVSLGPTTMVGLAGC